MSFSSAEKLLLEIQELPEESQKIIADLVAVLKKRYETKQNSPINPLQLEEQPFIGMWSDRQDTQNSSQWVRNIRQQHWHQ
ncbi:MULTISPECIES: hypothetical protein [Planktothricoides]|uniref:DUF2281 domain-containing protein n=2 Tax=Planktothricoides raciborskii TaxID=132608 RepID=A0AAU8JBI5_9CYAN|nr:MULTISPECIES: hypothetical protein [Planktothricoides]KOR36818.1 hypothetical protein AM228_10560 [Planktothricoides sp. SR001]MBD2545102.1 hypothetical protein [Planktothricoides raciborskii FACHB-1370]MBD2584242.1 hypothetical protein [Planktothricoides raciborskii FACHB-1261]